METGSHRETERAGDGVWLYNGHCSGSERGKGRGGIPEIQQVSGLL